QPLNISLASEDDLTIVVPQSNHGTANETARKRGKSNKRQQELGQVPKSQSNLTTGRRALLGRSLIKEDAGRATPSLLRLKWRVSQPTS
uniref:Ovule protein n=1 Tax=Bursaphelenchus xylophilus TaxID=6326 RepID=A0A1I7SNV2_BURXY